jgi:creatinine amidohydrolase
VRKFVLAGLALALSTTFLVTPVVNLAFAAATPKGPLVEFEQMTWPEVKAAIAAGKTTALIYTGGTEQRGPQDVNGGHTLLGRPTVKAIAEKLGNAIAMPVLSYTPNNANPDMPGTIGLTPELLGLVLERITEQTIANGFKNVVLMGDHGGGQGPLGPKNVYDTIAHKLDAKYAAQGIHVYYCDRVYAPAEEAFDKEIAAKGLPVSTHAGISDTSELMYLEEVWHEHWVRDDQLPKAAGTPIDPVTHKPTGPDPHTGITGDARASTKELGKHFFEMKVDYAVKQIQGFIPPAK